MAQWLSWLERRPVTAEVESSSLFWVVCGVLAQLGEHLPYKQRVTGSSPVGPIFLSNKICAVVAQLAEQLICNQQVTGSSPVNGFHIWNFLRMLVKKDVLYIWLWWDSRVAKGGRL